MVDVKTKINISNTRTERISSNETCLRAPIDDAVEDVDVFKLFEKICPIKYFKLRVQKRRDRIAGILPKETDTMKIGIIGNEKMKLIIGSSRFVCEIIQELFPEKPLNATDEMTNIYNVKTIFPLDGLD